MFKNKQSEPGMHSIPGSLIELRQMCLLNLDVFSLEIGVDQLP